MADHPNVARLYAAMEAYNRRDMATLLEHWSEDAVFHVGIPGPNGGDYRGREGVERLADLSVRLSDGTFVLDAVDAVADDTHGVVVFRMKYTRDAVERDIGLAYAVRFDGQGRQAEAWLLASDQAAYAAFLS